MPHPHRTVAACHHILVLYGHWAVNDPRCSGSRDFCDLKFAPLGPIHFGRKPDGEQPSREELRQFHQKHGELLNFPIWIDDAKRHEIVAAVAEAIGKHGYICYACGICGNHLHLVIRTHKHKALEQWNNIAESIRQRLRHRFPNEISAHHPVISAHPYTVLLFTSAEVWTRIDYANENPMKEGLAPQSGRSSPPTTTGRCTRSSAHHAKQRSSPAPLITRRAVHERHAPTHAECHRVACAIASNLPRRTYEHRSPPPPRDIVMSVISQLASSTTPGKVFTIEPLLPIPRRPRPGGPHLPAVPDHQVAATHQGGP